MEAALAESNRGRPHVGTVDLPRAAEQEGQRRSNAVQVFPDEDCLIRLVGAVTGQQHDEWTTSRYYLSETSTAKLNPERDTHRSTADPHRGSTLDAHQPLNGSVTCATPPCAQMSMHCSGRSRVGSPSVCRACASMDSTASSVRAKL